MTTIEIPTTVDLLPVVEQLHIVDKARAQTIPFGPNMHWPQRLLVHHVSKNLTDHKQTRAIVLKARQLGISTTVKGIEFALAMHKFNFRGRTVSHETDSNTHLLSMTQHYFDHYQFNSLYNQRNRSANVISFDPLNSRLGVITAKNIGGGRSQTVHFLHASEVAFWPDPGGLMASLSSAIPKTPFSFIILESTANGMGNWFHTTWDGAVANENDYTPFFFPWQTHPEYRGDYIGIEPIAARSLDDHELVLADQFTNCRLGPENLSILERSAPSDLLAELAGPMPREELLTRLAWRRWVIRNELAARADGISPDDLFLQEYPHIPSVAFLATGLHLFRLNHLNSCYHQKRFRTGHITTSGGRIRFTDDALGPFKVFEPPIPGKTYVVAGDPTFTLTGDPACIQVLDPYTFTQVATWRGRCTPGEFGDIMVRVGYFYNTALLAPETNKSGADTLARITTGHGYPNVWRRRQYDTVGQRHTLKEGWHTNTQSKHEAISNLQTVIYDHSLTFSDPKTFSELRNYVDLGGGKFGNANGEPNDDTVMSLAIAATVANYEFSGLNAPPQEDFEQLRSQVNDVLAATENVQTAMSNLGAQEQRDDFDW